MANPPANPPAAPPAVPAVPNPHGYPPHILNSLDIIRADQQETTDYYKCYILGEGLDWDPNQRGRQIAGCKVRRAGRYEKPELIYKDDGTTLHDWTDAGLERFQGTRDWYYGKDIRVGTEMKFQRAQRPSAARQQRNAVIVQNLVKSTQGTNLRYVKTLGAGGLGVTALFSATDFGRVRAAGATGRERDARDDANYYVIKTVLEQPVSALSTHPQAPGLLAEYTTATRKLAAERGWQRVFIGGMHFAQTFEFPRRQIRGARRNLIDRDDAIAADRQGALARAAAPLSRNRRRKKVAEILLRGRRIGPYVPPINRPIDRRPYTGPRANTRARRPNPLQIPPTFAIPARAPKRPPHDDDPVPHTFNIDANHIIAMEYLQRGDLFNFIITIDAAGQKAGNRVLWNIWMCFLRMIVGMDYPARVRRGRHNLDKHGPVEAERVTLRPNGRPMTPKNCVHFDIDPLNIFVGNFYYAGVQTPGPSPSNPNADEPRVPRVANAPTPPDQYRDTHHYVPCLKLGDFGLMHSWDENSSRDRANDGLQVQWMRRCNKPGFRAPEQFTKEWEWVDVLPGRRDPNNHQIVDANVPAYCTPVEYAGLYTWKTNLYQFALTMYCIITKRLPPKAPIATKIRITTRQPLAGPNPNAAPTTREAYTYGGYLLSFPDDTIDRQLRETLALCMCEKPADRPSWDWLNDQAGDKLAYYAAVDENDHISFNPFPHPAEHPMSEADEKEPRFRTTRFWCEEAFGDPPPPRLRDPAQLDAWCAAVVANNAQLSGWTYPTAPGQLPGQLLENIPFLP